MVKNVRIHQGIRKTHKKRLLQNLNDKGDERKERRRQSFNRVIHAWCPLVMWHLCDFSEFVFITVGII